MIEYIVHFRNGNFTEVKHAGTVGVNYTEVRQKARTQTDNRSGVTQVTIKESGQVVWRSSVVDGHATSDGAAIRIIRAWDDHEPVILGRVTPPIGLTTVEIKDKIERYWDEFKSADADSETDFLAFLGRRGFYVISDINDLDITVGV